MHQLTVEINNNRALKALEDLEQKDLIKITGQVKLNTPALPGAPMSLSSFADWINNAEHTTTVSFQDAKAKWRSQKQKLLKGK